MAGTIADISINVLCDQRQKQMLFNNPQYRYTPQNPYNGTFTKFQLDMRRKAEILKYSNTSSSTKTNNLTKAEKYAQLISGKRQAQSYQSKIITTLDKKGIYNTVTVKYPDKLAITSVLESNPNSVKITGYQGFFTYTIIKNGLIVDCEADNLMPTPTSSCGIPGPIVSIIDDESVPLYNFTNATINNAAYSESQTSSNNLWTVNTKSNVLLSTNISSNIGSLLINPMIDQPAYTFTLEVPIGIYAMNSPGKNGSATFTINGLFLDVKYSGSIVSESKIISLSRYSPNAPITVQFSELSTSINGYKYFAYIDKINISNILLYTNPGYVYDFFLTVNIDSANSIYTNGFTNPTIYANYTNALLSSKLSLLTVSLLPPTNLSISKSRDTTIDISFSAPINTTNQVISYTASANGIGTGIASSSANKITITGLTPSTMYNYLNVTAVYNNGSSTSTSVVSGTTLGFNPTQYELDNTKTTETSLTVKFINGSNPMILSYFIMAVPDPNSNNNQTIGNTYVDNVIVSSGPITINGLISGTKYNLLLSQYLTTGRFGTTTNDITGTTISPPPTKLSTGVISYNYFDLSYITPIGTAPIGYKIISTSSSGQQVVTNLSNTRYPTIPIRISGLSTGVTYTVAITAIYNSAIDSFNATSKSISVKTYYSSVTNLTASGITDTSFNLGYTLAPGTPPIKYNITITPKDGEAITISNIATLSNPYTINSLIPGTTYDITITSFYSVGSITSSNLTITTIGKKTSALYIKNPTLYSLDVSFNVPSGNIPNGYFVTATPINESKATVVYPVQPASPAPPVLLTSNLITVNRLISGTTYSVFVTSVYSSGNQDSDPAIGSTLANPPTNLNLENKTYNSITIGFTPPIGSNPNSYRATATSSKNHTTVVSNVDKSPIVITDLSSGLQYNIIISSVYDTGNYDSAPLTVSTDSSPATIFGININPLTDPSTNAITVRVVPPQSATLPNGYQLVANPETKYNGQTSVTLSNITPLDVSSSYTISGLISGTVYDVSLVSIYDTGNQTLATTNSGTTLANPPTINSITNPNINSLTVNFSPPEIGSAPINYIAVATPESYDNYQQIVTVNSISKNLTTYTIGNLVSATTYDISMIAVYDTGNFVSTGRISGTTTSNPPTSIIVTGTTSSTIDISYNPPIGSVPIGYYAIAKPKTTDVGQTSVTTQRTTTTQLKITGLFAGTTYDISMVAVYSLGNQISTISVSGNTTFSPPTITSLNKNITDPSTNAITVYFSPASGTLPSSYNATAIPDYTDNYQSIVNVNGLNNNITSFVIGNLISGTTYDISMSAVYATGYSGSNIISGNTLFNAPSI
jgi:hypothetical protein